MFTNEFLAIAFAHVSAKISVQSRIYRRTYWARSWFGKSLY